MDDRKRDLYLHSLTDEERAALEPSHVRWTRIGECDQCGECCKTLVSTWFMTGYNQESGPRSTGCIYLSKQPDGRYNCLIKTREFNLSELPQQVQKYYLQECLDYPNPDNPAHCPPRHHLPENCGYKIIEVK